MRPPSWVWVPLLAGVAGCPKGTPESVVDQLPEQVDAVGSTDPLAALSAGADSMDPGPRGRALALLITNVGPEPWGPRALLDPSDWVRRGAIEALGRRGDPVSRTLLEGVAADTRADPYLRGLAAMRAPGPASAGAITVALAAEHEAWRVAPLALAAVQLGDEAARAPLVASVASGELPLDLEFLLELGRSGEATLVGALEQAQERVEDEMVLPVASARLTLGDATAEQVFRKALAADDEEQRLEALDFLVEVDHPAATTLLRRASTDGPELVTWYADLALASREGNPDVFARAYAEPDREVRALAVRFAGRALAGSPVRRTGKIASEVVVEGMADVDTAVRIEACQAAARLRLAAADGPAERLLSNEVELVRIEAAATLLALRAL